MSQKILTHIPSGACILDIGCGDGDLLCSLKGMGYTMIGVDPGIPEDTAPASDDLTFLRGTGERLPVTDHWADCVLMQCVFSLCDPRETLLEIRRVLKPGGLLIITDLLSGTVTFQAGLCSPLTIHTREDFEGWFTEGFELLEFSDERKALIQMIIEVIFNDEELCISQEEQELLKKCKAGYGLWVWRRR
ncbi:MAG: class I SAM-dependent methyltransferase [Lachnospiraceae bacterium]|nr:class I SAM-dependent methyltransferase [Lachnospiraceae bacterium]